MPNSYRWKPFVDGKRECLECLIPKTVQEYYTRTDGSVSQKCRECIQKERRGDYKIKSGRRDENNVFIKQKECVVCKQVKDCSTNFKKIGGSRDYYLKVCNSCNQEVVEQGREERRKKGPKHDNEPKYCNICKKTKTIKDFSYNEKYKFYSYCCKPCDNNRGKQRGINNPERAQEINRKKEEKYKQNSGHKRIIAVYKRIDRSKGHLFGLTEVFVKEALLKVCYYCTYPVSGLDRIDNSIGHTDDNCVPCCTECNRARLNQFTHEEMKIIGIAIKQVKDSRNG